MEEFLIGAGLALLLALLAWSDSIGNLHKETQDLEKEFSYSRKLNLRRIRKIIRTELSPEKRLSALNKLIASAQIKDTEDINIIEQLIILGTERCSLERHYTTKYILVVALTNLFILSGLINYFIDSSSYFRIFSISIKTEFITIFLCISLVYTILGFILYLNKAENKYKNKIYNLMDEI